MREVRRAVKALKCAESIKGRVAARASLRLPGAYDEEPAVTALPAPDGLTVCRICHQPNFEGGLPAPRLAGQSYDYLLSALNSFADGTRDNNADMVKLMQATTPAQRETIARYLSSL
jgi:cytochrome c553